MAIEVIQQILAPDNAPYINRVRAESRVAKALLENMFQGLVETNDRGVTDRFATESEINENVQIFVNRILPVKMQPREMGASKNGASFSANSHYTQTVTVSIEVLTVIDDTIIVPRARQDTINVDLLAKQTDIYGKRLNTIINGMTTASKIYKTWEEERLGHEVNVKDISSADISGNKLALRFMECNDLLDEGDIDNGIDVFPEETRIAVFKMGARSVLKANGVLVLGGSNYAQDILKGKAISHEDSTAVAESGYWGDIDGVPVHGISNESLGHASGFLGLTEKDLKVSDFFGYVASSYANARGVSTIEQVKIVDAIAGQGFILQPFTKMGAVSWYAKGNVLITKEAPSTLSKGLFYYLGQLFSGIAGGTIKLKLKGAGSRLYPSVSAISCDTSDGELKVTAKALDDAGVDHAVAGHYIQTDSPVTSVYEFLKYAFDGTTTNDAVDHLDGTATSGTFTTDKYVTCLIISDDGSCTLSSVKVVA